MSLPGPFLLVATLVFAGAAATVSGASAAQIDAQHIAQLRTAAAQVSDVGPATLVLAQR